MALGAKAKTNSSDSKQVKILMIFVAVLFVTTVIFGYEYIQLKSKTITQLEVIKNNYGNTDSEYSELISSIQNLCEISSEDQNYRIYLTEAVSNAKSYYNSEFDFDFLICNTLEIDDPNCHKSQERLDLGYNLLFLLIGFERNIELEKTNIPNTKELSCEAKMYLDNNNYKKIKELRQQIESQQPSD